MKKLNVLIVILAMVVNTAFSQSKGQNKEELKAKKIAFVTEKLALTSTESEKLWPIVNSMQDEIKANHKTLKNLKPGKDKTIEDMSDSEVETLLNKGFEVKQKDLDIRISYHIQYVEILGVKRTAKLYHLQKEFRKSHKLTPIKK